MKANNLKLEPCAECPYPMDITITPLPAKSDGCSRFGISCRECGDEWIEEVED